MEVRWKLSDGRKLISVLQSFLPSTTFTILFLFPPFCLTVQMPQGCSHGKGQEHNSRAIKWGCFREKAAKQRSLLSIRQWDESLHLSKFILGADTVFEKITLRTSRKYVELFHTLWNLTQLRNIKISVTI